LTKYLQIGIKKPERVINPSFLKKEISSFKKEYSVLLFEQKEKWRRKTKYENQRSSNREMFG
jgi:hypothetical protein